MARIQHSIQVNVPVRTLYDQITQFKEFTAFWEGVESVEQINDTHLRWTIKSGSELVQFETKIMKQKPDHCIEWQDSNGSSTSAKIHVQSLTPYSSKADFVLDVEPGNFSGLVGTGNQEKMRQCLVQSLDNLKIFLETLELETGAWRGEVQAGDVTIRSRDAKDQLKQTAGQRSPASFSGSPTEVLDDEPEEASFGGEFKNQSQSTLSSEKSDRGIAR